MQHKRPRENCLKEGWRGGGRGDMGVRKRQGISTIGSISPMGLSLIRSKLCAHSVDGSALSGVLSLVSKLLVFVYNY